MLGAIIGDIVGSRFEFNNAKTTRFDLFAKKCSFTDDTICTVAIADSILNHHTYLNGYTYALALRTWCRRYPRPKGGYGASFKKWLEADRAQPYNSFGNGSAMRVSPIGWLFNDATVVEYEAARSAVATHNHPEGIKGAQVIALCVFLLRREYTKEQFTRFLEAIYGKIPTYKPFSNPFDESCMNAVPVSVSCFLASTDFEDAIRKAILVGGDSDTIAAITGSLAEAHYGIPSAIRDAGLAYLPTEMKNIVEQFYDRVR